MEPVQTGKDLKYYKDREKMLTRKVELNDKLKAVQLIKALGLDGAHERDILSKINFNKEPREVYEETKVAKFCAAGLVFGLVGFKSRF